MKNNKKPPLSALDRFFCVFTLLCGLGIASALYYYQLTEHAVICALASVYIYRAMVYMARQDSVFNSDKDSEFFY